MTADGARRAIDAVWRIESPKLIAGLARMVREVGLAEDLAQDALVAALEQWPESGVPDNPAAWLMAYQTGEQIHERLAPRRILHHDIAIELEPEPSGESSSFRAHVRMRSKIPTPARRVARL